MSCSPTTRLECAPPIAVIGSETPSHIEEGNRVLESIGRHEATRALLAFSELHGQIRTKLTTTRGGVDHDLLETERFIFDEVLQLICDRAQSITKADCVVIALAQKSDTTKAEMVCRAAAGEISVSRGTQLIVESEFLREVMAFGRVLRCDDGETDKRMEGDFAGSLKARSTVLVPLRGRHEQIGVMQAFSGKTRAFGDSEVSGLELLAELVLSALKPQDQDRRIHWLSDIAAEVLQPKPAVEVLDEPILETVLEPTLETVIEPTLETTAVQVPVALTEPVAATSIAAVPKFPVVEPAAAPAPALTASAVAVILAQQEHKVSGAQAEQIPPSEEQMIVPEQMMLLPIEEFATTGIETRALSPIDGTGLSDTVPNPSVAVAETEAIEAAATSRNWAANSRTGLKLVAVVALVALLFSAGAWWGVHSLQSSTQDPGGTKTSEANTLPQTVTAPAPPRADATMPAPDNLLGAAKADGASSGLAPVDSDKLAALPRITGLRHWSSSLGSTVVIDMQDQVPYEVHRLMSPERIYFDLHDTVLSHDLDGKTMDVGDVALSRVRIAQPVAGLTRIVLDTKDGANFSVSMETNPYRLVVELRGGDKDSLGKRSVSGHSGALPAANKAPGSASLLGIAPASVAKIPTSEQLTPKSSEDISAAKTGKFRIVLDAGHGGWDLGTVGRQGLLEKDLVLDVTQRLGNLLQSRIGADVKFTRDTDAYLPLEQRSDLANQTQADLFVSIHANYSSSASARGVETYYSDLFAAPGSKEAEKHDDGSAAKLTPVSLSLGGLHEKIEESRKLAVSVQRSLYSTLAANSPEIRNRGIKDSAFVVLTGTTMPSILTEISFVSSPEDERKLQSATYRQQIAEALFQGIARYRQASPRMKLAQLQTPTRHQGLN